MPAQLIRKKRDGGQLSAEELAAFAQAMAAGQLDNAQIGAMAMAIFLRGMPLEECAALTLAMRDTGRVFDWRGEGVPGPVLDKHSTGGVGDLVSLVLGPMLAACGGYLPMIGGPGLDHTGGTTDKLESIPGYCIRPEHGRLVRAVREAGVAIIGAGEDIAPADRKLYAIRDVTATVDCVPLIVASILSKKLAAGSDAMVLDVKRGSGALLPDPERGRELAQNIVATAAAAGLPVVALMTDMSQPLARSAGNAIEVRESIAMLRGEPPEPRLLEVTLALGAAVMKKGGLAADESGARAALLKALASGAAAERFARMVSSLGGPANLMERPDAYLAQAPVVQDVPAPRGGFIVAIDTRALGLAVIALGGGRTAPGQVIDPAVGLDRFAPLGASIAPGEPIARVHAASREAAQTVAQSVAQAYTIGDVAPAAPVLVERIA
ncbi:MAG TPA: thymidine phosphorylase [Steroidobacteraceae bacterium]|nr:thymidine phosphorylase [Steroidobacteraceae bacterium]